MSDVVAMTEQAAIDGLPLSAVLDDLRLVLDLAPGQALPAGVLRDCALAWASVHQELAAGAGREVAVRTWQELESHLWSRLGESNAPVPTWLLEVRAGGRSTEVDPAQATSPLASVLGPADRLQGAAQVLATFLDRPGEDVSLLRAPSVPRPHLVVALLVGDSEDRPAMARARLDSSPIGGPGALSVRVVSLADQADGMLSALRAAVGPRD
ncbi:hypothetical protein [Nocardioides sp. 1609]|uniref:hypothetical protein n=1 Tax=Nocardioides sp. 1609 TaxID=2508327 RepID=UPI00106F29F8|nr:hypothetical protein [Nocardioides sp. 1609]